MKRRDFLIKGSLGAFGLAMFPYFTWGKESFTEKKIQFINRLVLYGREHLELDIPSDFYTQWSEDEELHYYIYVSEIHSITPPKGIKSHLYFGNDKELALEKQKEYIQAGFHTLLFARQGKHEPKISNTLLSYSEPAIAFNIYHEAAHMHLKKNAKIAYQIEEAACDVMGNFGGKFYAERNKDLKLKEVEKQIDLIEKTNQLINGAAQKIGDNTEENNQIYLALELKIFKLFENKDRFLQDRFRHPINNAYLLMALNYCKYYDLLKQVAIKDKYINTFLFTLENLSKNEEKAIEQLQNKLKTE